MKFILSKALFVFITIGLFSCNKVDKKEKEVPPVSFHKKYMNEIDSIPLRKEVPGMENMILVKGGAFLMGATTDQGRDDERPLHKESVSDFYIDATEVTNAQFAAFVNATGYVTTAERPVDANHIAAISGVDPKTINTEPAALVFNGNPSMWWEVKKGASWKRPQGPDSSIEGKENYPVVQISWYDAMAYCKWAGKRLPTEEEYEYVARNGGKRTKYTWGDDFNEAAVYANFHQGSFPSENLKEDHFEGLAPVKSFKKNELGVYDIAGNVWEWTLNSYFPDGYQRKVNFEKPLLAEDTSIHQQKVIRGGSFLCNESYCSGYRTSARMSSSPDTGLEHLGFRCVKDIN